ncbi:hypothetical protein AADZ86_06915 [Colwelliaceae bacterium BS250]
MTTLIIIFAILMLLAGILLIVNPKIIFKVMLKNADKLWLYVSAVVVRLLLGTLLIYQASVSKFPVTMEVIGWVAIVAALVFAVIGRNKFNRLILWAFSLVKAFGRIAGVLALCFATFLIYSFV